MQLYPKLEIAQITMIFIDDLILAISEANILAIFAPEFTKPKAFPAKIAASRKFQRFYLFLIAGKNTL